LLAEQDSNLNSIPGAIFVQYQLRLRRSDCGAGNYTRHYDYADLIAVQEIIRDAAASSLDIHYSCSTADYKADGSIVTEADLAMQQALTIALAERYPDVAMLGEELSEENQSTAPPIFTPRCLYSRYRSD
jgi:hypothetical protein